MRRIPAVMARAYTNTFAWPSWLGGSRPTAQAAAEAIVPTTQIARARVPGSHAGARG